MTPELLLVDATIALLWFWGFWLSRKVFRLRRELAGVRRDLVWAETAARKLEEELREQARQAMFWKDLVDEEGKARS